MITAKHFLLALGLHNITGQRKIIEILNKLGHCLSYSLTCDIETAQAKVAQLNAESSSILPVTPETEQDTVLTFFWVDSFDINVDNQCGGGAINTTHLVAFQEKGESHVALSRNAQNYSLSRSMKKKSLQTETIEDPDLYIDVKKEPPALSDNEDHWQFNMNPFSSKYFFWVFFRKQNAFDQMVPSFSGWQLQNRMKLTDTNTISKTVETYLTTITSKVTEFRTIHAYMKYLTELAKAVNIPYVNITLVVGAAMNAYKLLWNYNGQFSNVVIHLGDFHFIKENFQVKHFVQTLSKES